MATPLVVRTLVPVLRSVDERLKEAGIAVDFVQDNQSLSRQRGVIRGLHFQIPPHPTAKLVRER